MLIKVRINRSFCRCVLRDAADLTFSCATISLFNWRNGDIQKTSSNLLRSILISGLLLVNGLAVLPRRAMNTTADSAVRNHPLIWELVKLIQSRLLEFLQKKPKEVEEMTVLLEEAQKRAKRHAKSRAKRQAREKRLEELRRFAVLQRTPPNGPKDLQKGSTRHEKLEDEITEEQMQEAYRMVEEEAKRGNPTNVLGQLMNDYKSGRIERCCRSYTFLGHDFLV